MSCMNGVFVGHVMAYSASNRRPSKGVVAGKMPADGSNSRTF
jgi:hypothetical protein